MMVEGGVWSSDKNVSEHPDTCPKAPAAPNAFRYWGSLVRNKAKKRPESTCGTYRQQFFKKKHIITVN